MRKKTCKVKRKLRVIPFLIIISLFFSISAIALGSNNENTNIEYQTIIVEKNDTLWSLVQEYYPDYKYNKQKAIYKIKKFNHLTDSQIFVGQELKMPLAL